MSLHCLCISLFLFSKGLLFIHPLEFLCVLYNREDISSIYLGQRIYFIYYPLTGISIYQTSLIPEKLINKIINAFLVCVYLCVKLFKTGLFFFRAHLVWILRKGINKDNKIIKYIRAIYILGYNLSFILHCLDLPLSCFKEGKVSFMFRPCADISAYYIG